MWHRGRASGLSRNVILSRRRRIWGWVASDSLLAIYQVAGTSRTPKTLRFAQGDDIPRWQVNWLLTIKPALPVATASSYLKARQTTIPNEVVFKCASDPCNQSPIRTLGGFPYPVSGASTLRLAARLRQNGL